MDIQVSFAPKPKVVADASIGFTVRAAKRVAVLIKEENKPNLKLRVSVDGGGCSGFQYNFAFDENKNEDDFVVETDGAVLLIDATSLPYLNGAEIDYEESLEAAKFVVNNPNASSTCGCGASFSFNV